MDENMKKNKFESNKQYFTISIYTICVAIICAIAFKTILNWTEVKVSLGALFNKLSPFAAGAFIAYLIHPLVKTIHKNLFMGLLKMKSVKISRFLSILISYIILLGFITLFFVFVIPELTASITDLTPVIPDLYDQTLIWVQQLGERLEALNPNIDLSAFESDLQNMIPTFLGSVTNFLTNFIPFLYTISMSIINLLLNIIISFIVSCYVLSDKPILKRNVKRLTYAVLSKKNTESLFRIIKECDHIFGGFIVGKIIDSTIIGFMCFGLMFILKLPFSVLISIIVGVTNMIPYFGPFIGAIPGAFILLIVSPKQMLIFLVMILALQQFDGLFLGPKILGDSTGVRPLWIIFSITLGGYVGGPLGMFLGVPTIAVLAYLINMWITKRLSRFDSAPPNVPDNFETAPHTHVTKQKNKKKQPLTDQSHAETVHSAGSAP